MLFGDAVINSERLTVPHYDMKNRGFMLWPLFEIAPDLHFPDGMALRAVLDDLGAESPPAGNPSPFLAFAAIVVIGCPKSLPL
jgi:7,8-dihydro-6-hydroxymethylpterin-pyrophosphokinase